MTEFGHRALVTELGGRALYLDHWGVGPFVIRIAGKQYRFEDSDRFGPALIKLNGDLRANPTPPSRSPFWRAHRIWRRQGRRVDGIACLWDEPKPTLLRRLNGRNALVVEAGEEDGRYIFVDEERGE